MKIAILCLALYAYVISANEESDGQPGARHTPIQGYSHENLVPYRSPVQPWPVPQPQFRPLTQPPRLNIIERFVISYFLYRALRPASTTTSTTVPITTATTTTATATTTTTANPLSDWTKVGECYYIFPESTANWNDAKTACEGLVDGGRLAVEGFSAQLTERQTVTDALGWEAGEGEPSFWIGSRRDRNAGTFIGVDANLYFGDWGGVWTGDIGCGRLYEVNGDELEYNNCDGPEYRYVCESCL